MTKEEIIRKLTSRKLWLAVAGFVSGLIMAWNGNAETAETVSGLILQGASVLGYLLAEGLADAANKPTGAVLEGISVEDLDEAQLLSVALQMGLTPKDGASREELLELITKAANEIYE